MNRYERSRSRSEAGIIKYTKSNIESSGERNLSTDKIINRDSFEKKKNRKGN
jgi:hypothetical protein